MAYKEGWVVINNVPTMVKTWGGWIEDTLPDGDSLIICICGNPGLSSFYHTFLETVHQQTGVPIWITCHAGQEDPPPSTRLECPRDPDLYNMAGQVTHKRAFIKQYVPANRKLFLIGHSLGAKVVSELLKDEQIAKHTHKCYLLMPTLERIGDTPNGRFLTRILAYGFTVTLFLVWIFSLFPHNARTFLISCWFWLTRHHDVDDHCMEAVCHLTQPRVLKRVFLLALDEIEQIKELDMKVLDAHCSKMKVYFARSDGWAPLEYKDSLKAAKPEMDVTVLGEQFYHTFVLDNPKEMAEIIAGEIKKEKVKVPK